MSGLRPHQLQARSRCQRAVSALSLCATRAVCARDRATARPHADTESIDAESICARSRALSMLHMSYSFPRHTFPLPFVCAISARSHYRRGIYMRAVARAVYVAYELQARLRAHSHPTKVVYTHNLLRIKMQSRTPLYWLARDTGSREAALFCCVSELLCAFVLMTLLLHLFLGQEHEVMQSFSSQI